MSKWLLVGEDADPATGKFKLFPDAWAASHIASGKARELSLDDWPLQADPVEYLEKHPDGPRAPLAKRLIQAGVV